MDPVNIAAPDFAFDETDPPGYNAGMLRLGPHVGGSALGASVYELPPGQALCPYHYEYGDEEWLIVLTGRPIVRDPSGETQLDPGDTVCFPPGPDGAHKVTNASDASEDVRVLMISTLNVPSVAVYPDSDKLGVFVGDYELMVQRDAGVDYWEGEG